jgi:hypothetical protein
LNFDPKTDPEVMEQQLNLAVQKVLYSDQYSNFRKASLISKLLEKGYSANSFDGELLTIAIKSKNWYLFKELTQTRNLLISQHQNWALTTLLDRGDIATAWDIIIHPRFNPSGLSMTYRQQILKMLEAYPAGWCQISTFLYNWFWVQFYLLSNCCQHDNLLESTLASRTTDDHYQLIKVMIDNTSSNMIAKFRKFINYAEILKNVKAMKSCTLNLIDRDQLEIVKCVLETYTFDINGLLIRAIHSQADQCRQFFLTHPEFDPNYNDGYFMSNLYTKFKSRYEEIFLQILKSPKGKPSFKNYKALRVAWKNNHPRVYRAIINHPNFNLYDPTLKLIEPGIIKEFNWSVIRLLFIAWDKEGWKKYLDRPLLINIAKMVLKDLQALQDR